MIALTLSLDNIPACLSFRFRLLDFFVRIWRKFCFLYFTLPLPVKEKRLAAPFLVFILGMLHPCIALVYFLDLGLNTMDINRPSMAGALSIT